MKMTSSAGALLKSAKETCFPLGSGSRKSGASVPNGSNLEVRGTMQRSCIGMGRLSNGKTRGPQAASSGGTGPWRSAPVLGRSNIGRRRTPTEFGRVKMLVACYARRRAHSATVASAVTDRSPRNVRFCPGIQRKPAQTRAGKPALPRLGGRIEVALVWLWCGFGVALVEPWWSLGGALGWPWGAFVLRSLCLVYGLEVALGWLWVALPGLLIGGRA